MILGGQPRVSGLAAAFVPERCQLQAVRLAFFGGDVIVGSVERGLALVEFPVLPVKGGVGGILEIDYSEDAPLPARMGWASPDPASADAFGLAIPLDVFAQAGLVSLGNPGAQSQEIPKALLDYLWQSLLGDSAFRVEILPDDGGTLLRRFIARFPDLFVTRREAMEMEERARRFFLALDVGTLAPGVPSEWKGVMTSVSGRLASRIRVRSIVGKDRVPVWPRSRRFAAQLQVASMFVQSLIVTHLYGAGGADLLDWAFTRFSIDKLAVTHPREIQHKMLQSHGAPDGIAFFRFAELALACIDHGVHPAFWRKHLGDLARTAHVYAEHGAELVSSGEYVYAYREGRRFPAERLRQLRAQYVEPAAVDKRVPFFEDKFTSMLHQALSARGSVLASTRPLDSKNAADFVRQDTDRSLATRAQELFQSTGLFDALAQTGL